MNIYRSTFFRVAAVGATAALVGLPTAAPAMAAEANDVSVVNTETIQVYMSATGEPEEQRVYEQLAFTGNGTVQVENPVSTDGLRNLDGFGGFDVEGEQQVAEVTVDGERRLRTVSSFGGELPLEVDVTYLLDGEEVEPGDVVGGSGVLEVRYHVTNVTGEMREITFEDGTGRQVTKQAEVVIPMVGSLTTTLPSSFTDVRSAEANMAGDGRGGTKLSFTMTLFPPIGSETSDFGYTAKVADGIVPPATVSALPVNPLESPSFKGGAASYAGGADTGAELTAGATTIDENLLKLRDGAAELLAGLIKLRDGAAELNAGLAEKAGPGSVRLAEGADQLADGLSLLDDGGLKLAAGAAEAHDGSAKLADGAGRLAGGLTDAHAGGKKLKDGMDAASRGGQELASGLGALSTGAGDLRGGLSLLRSGGRDLAYGFNNPAGEPDLVSGSRDLVTGLRLIRGGVNKLAAEDGIPKAAAGAAALDAGIGTILTKIGSVDEQDTLRWGLSELEKGITDRALPGAQAIDGGVGALLSTDPAAPGLPVARAGVDQAKAGVDQMKAGLDEGLAASDPTAVQSLLDAVKAARATEACDLDPACAPRLDGVIAGIEGPGGLIEGLQASSASMTELSDGLGGVSTGLGTVSAGLGGAITKIETQLKPGTEALVLGLGDAVAGADRLSAGAAELQQGLATQIRPGLQQLVGGLNDAVEGLGQLAPGTRAAAKGAGDLAAGIFKAGEGSKALAGGLQAASQGSKKLAAGAQRAKAGGQELAGGLGLLDGGMFELFEGLGLLKNGSGELAEGSGRLEVGLSELAEGAAKLSDGAGEASDGSGRLSDGANELADGLGDAATGSGRLADGLIEAADGAPKLRDGAQRLSDEGTSKLVEAGEETAQSYGEKYALIAAGAKRADEEGMAFGAPKGAEGATAFTYELAAADGEGGRNLTRGLGALAILGIGLAGAALRRRVV